MTGRFHIAFNGELYNYREELREELRNDYEFRSNSDTEVVLAAWQTRGDRAVCQVSVMLAFCPSRQR
ncbi:MAG: hypothetical protein R2735_14570 [Microthrixaceae bacterium]